jgi:hypothetical protein
VNCGARVTPFATTTTSIITEAELTATIRQLCSRISKIAKAKNGLVRAMEKLAPNGQTRLPL